MRLSPLQERLALLGAGTLAVASGAIALWPVSRRSRVVDAATDALGVRDARAFWRDVLPAGTPESQYPKDWCGAFALWCLHQAGLGLDLQWEFGPPNYGFLWRLPTTQNPQPGDVAYFDTNQHHALVTDIGLIGDRVGLINGNGMGGAVTASSAQRSSAAAYYSIEPLVVAASAGSMLPWLVGSASAAGVAAWCLLPNK